MDWSLKLLLTAFLVAAAAINGACGYAVVSGTVFCDQCKDGQLSLFDYPLSGIKVMMACPGNDGQFTTWREETTNWLGSYVMRFDGAPNLSGCYTRVSGSGQGSNGCGAAAGPQYVRLMFNMFDMEMYSVDPLLAQPAAPLSFCPRSATPIPRARATPPPVPARPPVVRLPQPPPLSTEPRRKPPPVRVPQPPPLPSVPRLPPPLPPVPRLPPMPRVPFLEASACPPQKWMMPEHRCYWRVVTPDTNVAIVFGPVAAGKYGTDMSLGQAMMGRGDPYRTLLREGTTALLNSYNSIQFPYHPPDVIQHMNWALLGSTRQALRAALSFMRANLGTGTNATCRFTPCK